MNKIFLKLLLWSCSAAKTTSIAKYQTKSVPVVRNATVTKSIHYRL